MARSRIQPLQIIPLLLLLLLLGAGCLNACSQKQSSHLDNPKSNQDKLLVQQLKILGYDKYFDIPAPIQFQGEVPGWDSYRCPEENCRCINGNETFLMVRQGTEPNKTVFWMAGGGACWPGRDDCTKEPIFYQSYIELGLGSKNDQNPVRDWNIVYLPYCDGSLHLGDNNLDIDGDGLTDQYFWGLKNTSAAVNLTRILFPGTQQILISGCSAGGAGTIGAAPLLRLAFPEADLHVLNISGPGLIPSNGEMEYSLAMQSWGINWLLPPDCPLCKDQFIYLYDWLLDRDDQLKVGFFSSYQDVSARTLWDLSPEDYQNLILDTTSKIKTSHPKTFQRFMVKGEIHCATDYSYPIKGISFWDWITWMLEDDPRWVDLLE